MAVFVAGLTGIGFTLRDESPRSPKVTPNYRLLAGDSSPEDVELPLAKSGTLVRELM